MAEQNMRPGVVATIAGIRDAVEHVRGIGKDEGLSKLRSMTEADWRARAEYIVSGLRGEYADAYILAYTTAAISAARMRGEMN